VRWRKERERVKEGRGMRDDRVSGKRGRKDEEIKKKGKRTYQTGNPLRPISNQC
jgi:hypothetical protein